MSEESNNTVADIETKVVTSEVETTPVVETAPVVKPVDPVVTTTPETTDPNAVLLQQIKAMQEQQAKLAEALDNLSKQPSKDNELDVDKLMAEIKQSVSASSEASTKSLLKKIQTLEKYVEKSKVDDTHFEKIAQEQVRKAQVEAYKKQVTANLAFPELVTGSTIEQINQSLQQQKEREAKLTSKGAKENLEEILKLNPSLARTINPSSNIENSSSLLDGTYKDRRDMLLDNLQDKRKFQSELNKLKRKVLDNGFGPDFK